MITSLRKEVAGFRFVETLWDDTLQALAARELGDAARWVEVAALNELVAPYLTTEPARVRPGVLLAGTLLRVPAPAQVATVDTDPDLVFGRDVLLQAGQLQTADGDLVLVAGRANLRQALKHRLDSDRGELLFHPEYGSLVGRLVGTSAGPTATLLAAEYGRAAIEGDDRIAEVSRATADAVGDSISVTLVAHPIVGRPVDVSSNF